MAETTDVQRLIVQLEAQYSKLSKELAKANGEVTKSAKKMETDFAKSNAAIVAGFKKQVTAGINSELSKFRTGLLGLINPSGLLLSAFTALGGAALGWITGANDAAAATEQQAAATERMSAAIDRLRDEYNGAADAQSKLTDEQRLNELFLLQQDLRNSAQKLREEYDKLANALDITRLDRTTEEFIAIDDALQSLRSGLAAGTPDVEAFRTALLEVGTTTADETVANLVEAFLTVTAEAGATADQVTRLNALLLELSGNGNAATATLLGMSDAAERYGDAIADLQGLAIPALTDTQVANDALERALGDAQTLEEVVAARDDYNDAIARIDAEEAARQAEKDARAGESASREIERLQEQLAARVEAIRQSTLSQEQLESEAHAKRLEDLQAALDQDLITREQHQAQVLALTADYEADQVELTRKAEEEKRNLRSQALSHIGSILGSLSDIIGQNSKKQFEASKKLAMAEAAVNAGAAIVRALAGPFPYLNAAAIAAATAAQIAGIRRQTYGGGGGAATAPAAPATGGEDGGGAAAAPGQSYNIQLIGRSFGADDVGDLVRQIEKYNADGGPIRINISKKRA